MAHVDELAKQPRPAGSDAAAVAQDYCANHLTSLGFTVTRRSFEYSALPGRFGAPIIGAVAGGLLITAAKLAADGNRPWMMGGVPLACIIVLGLARWLGGAGAGRLPFLRTAGTNLEATRGVGPRVWLVAHIDSKSQPVSTAVRTTGVLLIGVAAALGVAASIAAFWASSAAVWNLVGFLAAFGAVPVLWSVVGSRSDGAADNASGVAAALTAAEQIRKDASVGILISDAEELALAGARAWVTGSKPAIAINCDTIDDAGRLVIMRYGGSIELARQAHATAREVDPNAIVIRPPPGVLTDSVAFADAGWRTVTLSRGTLRTLNRIHTVRDNLHYLRGTGIPAAARVLARLVEELA